MTNNIIYTTKDCLSQSTFRELGAWLWLSTLEIAE